MPRIINPGYNLRFFCDSSLKIILLSSVERQEASTSDGQYVVQCLPLYSLLQALDNPTVNYMR